MMTFWKRKEKAPPPPPPEVSLYTYREARALQESEKAKLARGLWNHLLPPVSNPIADMLIEAKENGFHA